MGLGRFLLLVVLSYGTAQRQNLRRGGGRRQLSFFLKSKPKTDPEQKIEFVLDETPDTPPTPPTPAITAGQKIEFIIDETPTTPAIPDTPAEPAVNAKAASTGKIDFILDESPDVPVTPAASTGPVEFILDESPDTPATSAVAVNTTVAAEVSVSTT